ncbi:helix-turn-helix transcriptional regulator [Marinicella sp. W31]|uniref:helix-turn-helix transcriptional regulator n=1 Tax=Marinicella sp. W31 TaxID=3023713 RepID=UPI0037570FFE
MKNRIRVLRAELGMSQKSLSEVTGVSRHAIMAIEKEKHDPSITLASKIARALKTPLHHVFDLNDID